MRPVAFRPDLAIGLALFLIIVFFCWESALPKSRNRNVRLSGIPNTQKLLSGQGRPKAYLLLLLFSMNASDPFDAGEAFFGNSKSWFDVTLA
jgi:hypothetical protein